MHFRDEVIAFIGPSCAFALEPVARLAAYWNTPIITGMGDQVYKENLRNLFQTKTSSLTSHCLSSSLYSPPSSLLNQSSYNSYYFTIHVPVHINSI